jgi:hypothetical protein
MTKTKALRDKAEHYRSLAQLVTDASAKATLVRLAQELTDQAEEVEQPEKAREE